MVLGLAVLVVSYGVFSLLPLVVQFQGPGGGTVDFLLSLGKAAAYGTMVALLCLLVSCGLSVRLAVVSRRKGQQVFEAMDSSPVAMERERSRNHLWKFIAGVVALAVAAWQVATAGDGYYLNDPVRLLLPGGLILFVIILSLLEVLQKRRSSR
jgi:hypothetical protein